ncbi:hypothetical protein TNCV_1053131, partial [Trichonephila clavipes]
MNFLHVRPTHPYLARLSDLSPIQNTWDVMRRRLQPSRHVDDFHQQLETIWHEIPQVTPPRNLISLCHSGLQLAS